MLIKHLYPLENGHSISILTTKSITHPTIYVNTTIPKTAAKIEADLLTNSNLTVIMVSHTAHQENMKLFDDIIRM